jgi:polysaccharide biosynthesis transport protein
LPEPEEGNLLETAGRLLSVLIRRRWWFLPIAGVTAIATVLVLLQLPNRYTSEATLLVVQQQVPERYVAPTTTTNVSEALQAMTQEVLSRTRLAAIVAEFGLYPEERKSLPPERVNELMFRNISIAPLKGNSDRGTVNSFKISFTAGSPDVAQQVTSRLTSLFISENLKTRAEQATNTAEFLGVQLETAQSKLAEQERRVREFKMRNLGELPEQQAGNLAILTGLQTQLQNTAAAKDRAEQQRVYLESLIRGLESAAALRSATTETTGISPTPGPIQDAQRELTRLEAERRRLLNLYTPGHPDVAQNRSQIVKAEETLARLQAAQKPAGEGVSPQTARSTPADSIQENSMAQVRSQLEANRVEAENLNKEYKRLLADIDKYQTRLNQTPVREQEMSTILRNQELLKQGYSDLSKKKIEAELATSLEKQQAGQQFRLVDAPSLPTVPTSPKRVKMSLIGAVAGIVLGAGVALLVDFKGRPFYSEKALKQRFAKTMVVCIPVLQTPAEKRFRRWGKALEWVAGTALVLAVFVAESYVYLHG